MENNTTELVFTDADLLITHLTALAVNKNNVFRGYGKQSELLPNIIREKDWSNKEINLLYEFEKYGLQYFSANNPVDFMSYAQHYGLPTRLLDFTYNPFTALSFALFMPKSTNYSYPDDRTYYYIRFCNLHHQIHICALPYYDEDISFQSGSFASQCDKTIALLKKIVNQLDSLHSTDDNVSKMMESYFKKIYSESQQKIKRVDVQEFTTFKEEIVSKFENRKALFLDVNQCNQRIVMQQGLFLFPYTLEPSKHLSIIINNTSVLKIHKDIRDKLLDYLDTIGQNSYRLMPDLQSVCEAVKRKVIEERQSTSTLFKKKEALYPEITNSDIDSIHILLKSGYERYKQTDGYANVAPVGTYIKKAKTDFNVRNYGFSKLSELIASFPNKYEITKNVNMKVPVAMYRCL